MRGSGKILHMIVWEAVVFSVNVSRFIALFFIPVFLLQVNSEANWALEVMLTTSIAILNFTDLHDAFCEVCGNAGLVKEYLELSEQLKIGLPEFDDQKAWMTTHLT